MRVTKGEIFIICMLLCGALVRYFFFRPVPPDFASAVGGKVAVTGIVTDPPDVRLTNQRITLTPSGQETNILLVVPLSISISYGDKIRAQGTLETPQNFLTSSGKEFNYERYLANQDIYFVIKNPDIQILSHNNGNFIKSYLFKLSDAFMKNIGRVIARPESDLADGLVLGARGGFDSDTRDEFIATGTIHIVALSGYNVTIVAEGVMKVFGLIFSQTVSIIFGFIVIVLFIVMAGASSTAVRAGIMASIALLGKMTGRKYDAGRALVIAALLMIFYDARVLTDISFQLSFLATFGVLFVMPKVMKWVWFVPLRFGLRDIVATTISATMSVLPILLYATGILSLVSLPANILILSLIPATMLCIFVTGILGFISPVLSIPPAFVSHILLSYILSVINFFASLPFASVTIASFPLTVVFILYGALLWWVFRKSLDTKQ
jgi:competence protein ComEC